MSAPVGPPSGFAVFSSLHENTARRLADATAAIVGRSRVIAGDNQTCLVLWGSLKDCQTTTPILLCHTARMHDRDVTTEDITWKRRAAMNHPAILPPFAAIEWDFRFARFGIETDWLGMRHVYRCHGPDWAGFSSSAAVLAAAHREGLDGEALSVQSLLGWQLGPRTPFAGVSKLPSGARMTISRGRVSAGPHKRLAPRKSLPLDEAAPMAAQALRTFMTSYLHDHPDAVLQLTGGHDSRILLGAIPRDLRSSVEAMTLAVPGSPDVAIAAQLARAHGMKHRIVSLDGLESIDTNDAYRMCQEAARGLDCSADPLAFASLTWVESLLDQRPRLAGLGGEVARGFYYFGPTIPLRVAPRLSSALAQWRMFPNDRVNPDALEPAFARDAHTQTIRDVDHALHTSGQNWWQATDEFYLWERMQRWAGVLATATCLDRDVINPMLDSTFIEIARSLPPSAKRNMRFLSRILLELDPELADIPLDNRPSPRVYSRPTPLNKVRLGAHQTGKIVGKVRQRLSRQTHPSAGTAVLANKVVEYWRAEPGDLARVYGLGVFRPVWLDQLVAGEQSPDPATVAFLLNLVVAGEASAAVSAESANPNN